MARCTIALAAKALAAAFVAVSMPAAAQDYVEAADPFIGTYVGVAEVFDGEGELLETRDMDIEIFYGDRNQLTLRWINVSLVDGRRDVPGVERRVQQMVLVEGGPHGSLIEDTRGSVFSGRRNVEVMAGDALHWARFQDGRLDVFSFGVNALGEPVLHDYERILTEQGLEIVFDAYIDGRLVRHIVGNAIRVE
ncbi:MAG: hypothetical protein RLO50_21605 [Azospirillaceae bacterium]